MSQQRHLCLSILGPTASGKTGFAVELAKKLNGEIVCVDSTTVYKGFDIGTCKPTPSQRAAVPHHLLDILEPDAPFSASDFVSQARTAIEGIRDRGKLPVLVGGSYFYLRALQNGMYPTGRYDDAQLETIAEEFTKGDEVDSAALHDALSKLDRKAADGIHPNDKYRLVRALAIARSGHAPSELKPVGAMGPEWLWVKYAMAVSRKALFENITQRTRCMIQDGLVNETRALSESHPRARALGSIGYAETIQFLKKPHSLEALAQQISENSRKLLKRQITWLRSDPEVRFIDSRDLPRVELELANLKHVLENSKSCNR